MKNIIVKINDETITSEADHYNKTGRLTANLIECKECKSPITCNGENLRRRVYMAGGIVSFLTGFTCKKCKSSKNALPDPRFVKKLIADARGWCDRLGIDGHEILTEQELANDILFIDKHWDVRTLVRHIEQKITPQAADLTRGGCIEL